MSAEVSLIAQKYFGVSGKITQLAGEYDANFHVTQPDGQEFLLKISHHETDVAVVVLQNAVLQHLANQNFFNVPAVLHDTYKHNSQFVRLFSFIPGDLLANHSYYSQDLLKSLGEQVAYLTKSLSSFQHPAAQRALRWDLKNATWIEEHLNTITVEADKNLITYFLERFKRIAVQLGALRQSIIHGDINDYNVLTSQQKVGNHNVCGFIDFGDLVQSATICELAITIAYAVLKSNDPITAAAKIIHSYHQVFPLQENEITILYDLICIRLCVSVINSAIRKQENPNDSYLTISEKPAWQTLKKLREVHPQFALYVFRNACGWEPCPQTSVIKEWVKKQSVKSLLDQAHQEPDYLDLSPGSIQTDKFAEVVAAHQDKLIIGKYNEARLIYSNDQYELATDQGLESRTIHVGLDLFGEANTAVYAPLDGVIHSFADNNIHQDYGPTIILQHDIPNEGISFYTLYGHLSRDSLQDLFIGKKINKGELVGYLGSINENGGWISHLHFQIITDMFDFVGTFPGVAAASMRDVWLSINPDPNLITRFKTSTQELSKEEIIAKRKKITGKNVTTSYKQPLEIVRGIGQYLFDENGGKYLDCVNNIAHVGHCHPQVVAAGAEQMAILNTNTRYLHPYLVEYAERLLATLPAPLEVCYFVCSGSEANELALRLARNFTNKHRIAVMDHGYHGNTSTLIEISPYKFNGKGGKGKPDYVQVFPMPDQMRNTNKDVPEFETGIAAFICEPLLSCGGQIVLPEGHLKTIYNKARSAGAVCIADEIQTGLGRVGTHMWGFETLDVIPDIVTMGKPLGNGHPIGAVVTTRAIADAFCNGMEYFNSFGGNPVSCAIGLAVLDVIDKENLQQHAMSVGNYFKQLLNQLMLKFDCIAEIRGSGLFLGIELVTDRISLTPATDLACYVINSMKDQGILLSSDGPHQNVLKIKPPLSFNNENCDFFVKNLDCVLARVFERNK